ncbi:hypothetical protein ACXYTJ_14385 [Gilvimarinus sp. F26214L]|uniref:hypothetical protein n=1 Tax=Gilvimarinus sp. DZF01 TaxID=3461371 RepID=UPI004045329C
MKVFTACAPAIVLLASLAFNVAAAQDSELSFFVTSKGAGDGANLGGLEGADRHCQMLAEAAGAGQREWRAYLSTQTDDGKADVHARDRIGTGPWHNAKGEMIAKNVEELHSEDVNIRKETALDERGELVNGRGDSPNQHDILTGSQLDGRAFDDGNNHTCANWTSNAEGSAQAGHHDRTGGGPNPTSWNSAHGTRGCSQENLISTGGNGYFYCFAAD